KGKDKDGKPVIGGGNLPRPKKDKGKTRDKVAEAVGMSGRTYDKAKHVVEAAEKEPEKHAETVKEMDRSGKVDAAYKKVRQRRPNRTRGQHHASDEEVKALTADAKALLARLDAAWFKRSVHKWPQQERWELCQNLESISKILRWHSYE